MESHNPRGLLIAIGLVLLAVGGQPFVNYISGDASLHSALPSTIACLLGVGLVVFGFFWKPKPKPSEAQNSFMQTLIKWSNSPIPYAIILILLWCYFETLAIQRNNEIASLRNDEQSIAKVIDRLVMPRQLTKRQQRVIADFLSQFPPHVYAFVLANNYEEGGSYRSDLEQALIKASWKRAEIAPYVYTNELREGVTLQLVQPPNSQRENDPKNPNAEQLLEMAFGLAGVQIDGSGGGGGTNNVEERVIISIGKPRKDAYVLTLPEDQY